MGSIITNAGGDENGNILRGDVQTRYPLGRRRRYNGQWRPVATGVVDEQLDERELRALLVTVVTFSGRNPVIDSVRRTNIQCSKYGGTVGDRWPNLRLSDRCFLFIAPDLPV